jgi:ferrous iron transport protein A
LAEASGPPHWPKIGVGGWAAGKSFLQPSLNCHNLATVKQKPPPAFEVLEGRCAGPELCPLSRVKAGAVVCIKELSTAPDVTNRLRELGFCEEQRIKLLTRQSNFICQVCNARLAISERLADSIMVEAVPSAVSEA